MKIRPLESIDFYKAGHRDQYPPGTEYVYSNFTARSSRLAPVLNDFDDKVVFLGLQGFIKEFLIEAWNKEFFSRRKEDVLAEYKRRMDTSLGVDAIGVQHISELHDLGYLPLVIMALPEGSRVNIKVPMFTVMNTDKRFFWLTNYIETAISSMVWKSCTTATIAYEYKKLLMEYAEKTGSPKEFVPVQGHDFSARGMSGIEDAARSGMGHLTSFIGTDSVSAIGYAEDYYKALGTLVGVSVPACYDSETEVLTENGFIKFKELKKGIKVAQYFDNGSIGFVEPSKYYNMPYKGKMVHWKSNGIDSTDILVTPNHRMVRFNKTKGEIQWFEAGDTSYKNRKGFSHRNYLPISGFNLSKNKERVLSSIDKIKVAFQADGSFPSRDAYTSGQIRFSFKKDRKIKRLEFLLKETGLNYSKNGPDGHGYYSFWVNPENSVEFKKDFSWIGLDKSIDWYRDLFNEVALWDGTIKNNTIVYSSTNKACVDKLQACAAIAGMKTKYNIYEDKREDYIRQPLHSLNISYQSSICGSSINRDFIDYNGTVHCVSVPSKMLVIRRNNKVAVCGNTEHSVMCMGGKETETETFRRLIKDVYPKGIVSIVSDTWNFWDVLTKIAPSLKEEILSREPNELGLAKVVFRPDSGDPVKVICGYNQEEFFARNEDGSYEVEVNETGYVNQVSEAEFKGAVELLWDEFGGTVNEKGYKVLNERVGLIYGDSITLQRAKAILEGLEKKGFASCNIVFGIGSYTYQHVTRDSFGFAMKATYGIINGEPVEIFKDPVTDSGTKKSAKGLLRVEKEGNDFVLYDQQDPYNYFEGELKEVFLNGQLLVDHSLEDIRNRLNETL